mmetsp:Transcript_28158/g.24888  ORF Transcript_28158/g.24888 Transcript_28158/m.24888 type:complete len:98 (+) Transcript_28158:223-516(+)
MVDIKWDYGLYYLFKLNRTKEIYTSMYCSERRAFYAKAIDLAEDLVDKDSSNANICLHQMMKGLVQKPYATLTFLKMFKYIHLSGTKIHVKDCDPTT